MPRRLNFDPQQLEVLRTDVHLAPVAARELGVEALRHRFQSPPSWAPEILGEQPIGARTPAHASVLIAFVQRAGGLHVLLTQRTDHLTDHPGQISFPGGRAEPFDADSVATALREAEEEIGLQPVFVDVLGCMPVYLTGTGFIVTPVVAVVRQGFVLTADPSEVADVFEVPLAFLMTPANHRWHAVDRVDGALSSKCDSATLLDPRGGRAVRSTAPGALSTRREFLSMPWDGVDASGALRRYFIWGATAAMIRNLYRFLSAGVFDVTSTSWANRATCATNQAMSPPDSGGNVSMGAT